MKQSVFLIILFSFFAIKISAQEKICEVAMDAIKGIYSGDCNNGKANGKGKSVGMDQYEGNFVNGYPEGKGIYTWKDGHYFIGLYKRGRKEGKGDMHVKSTTGQDSVITGFWKKDKYIGFYENQYEVIATTSKITKVDCRLTDKSGEVISVTVHQLLPGIVVLNNINSLAGTYNGKNTQELNNSSVTRIDQVTFPFKAIFYFSNGENAQILFNEKGSYDVYIDIQ